MKTKPQTLEKTTPKYYGTLNNQPARAQSILSRSGIEKL